MADAPFFRQALSRIKTVLEGSPLTERARRHFMPPPIGLPNDRPTVRNPDAMPWDLVLQGTVGLLNSAAFQFAGLNVRRNNLGRRGRAF